MTARVHPDIRILTESIARTLNLANMGADFITTDISRCPSDSGGRFNEVNVVPGMDGMIAAGWPVERAGALALGQTPGRIPLRLFVVADDAKDRALAAARSWQWMPGRGWAAWDQAANAGAELSVESGPPWAGVQALMGHRNLSRAAVIATDLQIHEHGLPQDKFLSAHVACDLNPLWREVLQQCCDVVTDADAANVAGGLHAMFGTMG